MMGTLFFFLVPMMMFFLFVRLGAGILRGVRRFEGGSDERGRRVPQDESDPPNRFPLSRPFRGPSMESRIFRLAYKLRGKVTVSDVILETGMGLSEAEEFLDRLADGVRVVMEVSTGGLVTCEFPEIISRLENE